MLDTAIHALTVTVIGLDSASPNTTGEMEVDPTTVITVIGLGTATLNTAGEDITANPTVAKPAVDIPGKGQTKIRQFFTLLDANYTKEKTTNHPARLPRRKRWNRKTIDPTQPNISNFLLNQHNTQGSNSNGKRKRAINYTKLGSSQITDETNVTKRQRICTRGP